MKELMIVKREKSVHILNLQSEPHVRYEVGRLETPVFLDKMRHSLTVSPSPRKQNAIYRPNAHKKII